MAIIIPPRWVRLAQWAAVAAAAVILVLLVLVVTQNRGLVNAAADAVREARRADQALCDYARRQRAAAILDVQEQARILIDVAARNADEEGRVRAARRIRLVTGPAFITQQVAEARARRPPIDCTRLTTPEEP